MCVYLFAPDRGQPLFLFVNKQLCYSRQNKNFSIKTFQFKRIVHPFRFHQQLQKQNYVIVCHIICLLFRP